MSDKLPIIPTGDTYEREVSDWHSDGPLVEDVDIARTGAYAEEAVRDWRLASARPEVIDNTLRVHYKYYKEAAINRRLERRKAALLAMPMGRRAVARLFGEPSSDPEEVYEEFKKHRIEHRAMIDAATAKAMRQHQEGREEVADWIREDPEGFVRSAEGQPDLIDTVHEAGFDPEVRDLAEKAGFEVNRNNLQ